jgi:subtilisin-like proprotein convertase family protein
VCGPRGGLSRGAPSDRSADGAALALATTGSVDSVYVSRTPYVLIQGSAIDATDTLEVHQAISLQEVKLDLKLSHPSISALWVTLRSPSGTEVVLQDLPGGSQGQLEETYSFPTEFAGETGAGTWQLTVHDEVGEGYGYLFPWTLHLIGETDQEGFLIQTDPVLALNQQDTFGTSIDLRPLGDFSGEANVSLDGADGLSAGFYLDSFSSVPGSASLIVATSCSTPIGTFPLTLTVTSGDVTHSTTLPLVVRESATFLQRYERRVPLAIPDRDRKGIAQTLTVSDERLILQQLTVEVHLRHPAIGQLTVSLIAPDGRRVTLHDRSGGSTDDLDRSYEVDAFDGINVHGTWTLKVTDAVAGEVGTLGAWVLHADTRYLVPVVDFSSTSEYLSASFTDQSFVFFDCEGALTNWRWSFGDGTTSTELAPQHTYAVPGTYTVTLEVTENHGITGSRSKQVVISAPPPVLTLERFTFHRKTHQVSAKLSWLHGDGASVDIQRNGQLVASTDNRGRYRDQFTGTGSSFTWRVCEQSRPLCSNPVQVQVNASRGEATVVTEAADGSRRTEIVPFEEEP